MPLTLADFIDETPGGTSPDIEVDDTMEVTEEVS